MFIEIQVTPNPKTLKFLLGEEILQKGQTFQFSDTNEAKSSIMATKLFTIEGVSAVFIGADFVSVTVEDESTWDIIRVKVVSYIQDIVATGAPVVDTETAKHTTEHTISSADEDSEIVNKIIELFEERIRPAVAMDGGDIVFREYKDGTVYITMHGSCSGCPSSTITLKNGIENMLKYYISDVKEVVDMQ